MKKINNMAELADTLGLSKERGELAELKAKLTKEIIKAIGNKGFNSPRTIRTFWYSSFGHYWNY